MRPITRRVLLGCVTVLGGCGGGAGDGSQGTAAPPPLTAAPIPAPAPSPTPSTPTPTPAGSATVSWTAPSFNTDGSSVTDVSGFRIRYGTSPASMTNAIDVPGARTTSYVVTGLANGTYYFAVETVNAQGVASAPSNSASLSIP